MDKKIKAGILGATGAVGQNYALLLENHPWFEVSYIAASPANAGKKYQEAVSGKWFMDRDIPKNIRNLVLGDANKVQDALEKCDFVFSSVELDKESIKRLEIEYASAGFPVISNNSAHRFTPDVPMIIPEINPDHIQVIRSQQENYNFKKGFIVTKPNCSIQSCLTPIRALMKKDYKIDRIVITTEQASSGAGYPGVPSLDLIDNIIPYIAGEEEKTENEPLKIFGRLVNNIIVNNDEIKISATCTRVPLTDGHTAIVNLGFQGSKPSLEEIINIWENFQDIPQILELPSAPLKPIHYRYEDNRPQPKKDRYNEKGMAVTVGRLRKCDVLDIKFVGLSHNTIRGAAGGAILTAEMLHAERYF